MHITGFSYKHISSMQVRILPQPNTASVLRSSQMGSAKTKTKPHTYEIFQSWSRLWAVTFNQSSTYKNEIIFLLQGTFVKLRI